MTARLSSLATALLAVACVAGCARRDAPLFRVDNARAHVDRLAGAIGSRPVGTTANANARAYLIDQLRLYGFEVRVQEVDAVRPEHGQTARVSNIIAVKPGARPDAIAIVAHYDSVPDGPGAMDDGLGTAVSLEAGRVLAARAQARYSLVILLTDGEEADLMGAAGAVDDPELRSRVRAFINLESIGASGPSLLFESGPGNETLVRAWARAAPRPRGSSYAVEIYKRLPNDTDFTILKRWGAPGLNFSPVGDSHAYHTSRDLPERLTTGTIQQTGETTVALVTALDGIEIERGGRDVRFSDLLGRTVVVLADWQGRLLAILAVLAGLFAWARMARRVFRAGTWHALSTGLWGASSLAAAVGAMLGAVWLLRAAREVYHPWYAHGGRLLALLIVCGAAAPWYVTRLAWLVPERLRYVRTPESIWTLVLPVWIALVTALEWTAPAASHVWSIPVLVTAGLLSIVPASRPALLRVASVVALAVCVAFFVPDGVLLFHFLIAIFGRLPIVTPFWIYPAFVALIGLMVAPPAAAATIGLVRGRVGHGVAGALLLLGFAITLGLAVAGDAYTPANPLRRYAWYVSDHVANVALWNVSGNEPGLDLDLPAAEAARWRPAAPGSPAPLSLPLVRPRGGAFHFRRDAELSAPPATVSARTSPPTSEPGVAATVEYELAVLPAAEGLSASIVLPPGLVPVRATPAGTAWGARWRATYLAIPKEGVSFRVTASAADAARLAEVAAVIGAARLPGGEGGELPRFLPRQHADWAARAVWIVRPAPSPEPPALPGPPVADPPEPAAPTRLSTAAALR
jgi:hypothetical protein